MDKIEMIASGVAMGNMRSEMIEGSEYLFMLQKTRL
jgi:hypothetical protein